MKQRGKKIILLAILVIIFLAYFIFMHNTKKKITENLNTRYPIDTFSVEKCNISLIPLGAKAKVKAINSGTIFDVNYIFTWGKKEPVIEDNLYEVKTEIFVRAQLKNFLNRHKDWIEGIKIDAISYSKQSFDSKLGVYPARVNFLLSHKIANTTDFMKAVTTLNKDLIAEKYENISLYRFYSFPGSITETSAMDLKLDVNNLTEPTLEPTPTPTPNPRTTTKSTEGNKNSSNSTNNKSDTLNFNPIFMLELNVMSSDLGIGEDNLYNAIRLHKVESKDLNNMQKEYNLNSEMNKYIQDAAKNQRRDKDDKVAKAATKEAKNKNKLTKANKSE